MRYLDLEDLLHIAGRTLGEVQVSDVGLLASAAARPQASAFGEDTYPSVYGKAAALLHSLANNDPLVDGNKRLALAGQWRSWVSTTFVSRSSIAETPSSAGRCSTTTACRPGVVSRSRAGRAGARVRRTSDELQAQLGGVDLDLGPQRRVRQRQVQVGTFG